jgi:EAL domain-containing protein (putative c-di-GMP-specific phosphodiesterase class I)
MSVVEVAPLSRNSGDHPPLSRAQASRMLERILERGTLRAAYQPIVDLATGETVAFEALARGPKGPMESPGALFDAAHSSGLLPHLEWACRQAALGGAIDARLGTTASLFVNVEPSIAGGTVPAAVEAVMRQAKNQLRVVLELTERDLTRRPAELLQLVRWARANWWGVALDDVGAHPASLALLPFVRPDVVKLDMRLIQEEHDDADRAVIKAVRQHCFRTGAVMLAEGIETEAHESVARSLGATLGQGWRFGAADELPARCHVTSPVRLLVRDEPDARATPYPFVEAGAIVGTAKQSELEHVSEMFLRQVGTDGAPVVLASFGHAGVFTPAMADRYEELAGACSFTGVAGVGLEPRPASAVRYSPLAAGDPLAEEWAITVVGPHTTMALAARGLRPPAEGTDPEVEVVVTADRELVLAAARALMGRVVPAS